MSSITRATISICRPRCASRAPAFSSAGSSIFRWRSPACRRSCSSAVGLIDLLYQFWIHTELIGKLGWFDRVFASPSNHRVHHGINDPYLDKNYGGIFILWDRLFGTFEPEVETPVFGVRGGLATFDPIAANLSYYATMADLCRRATDWRDKLRVWVAPPGLGSGQSAAEGAAAAVRPHGGPPVRSARRVDRVDPCTRGARRDDRRDAGVPRRGAGLPLAAGLAVFAALAASLWAMGALLDGRIALLEALFVFAGALTSASYALDWPTVEGVAKPAALVLLIASLAARQGEPSTKRLVLAALAASLVGDVLLMAPSLFLPGLVAFLVAHGFYIAAFSRGVGFLPSRIAAAAIGGFAALTFASIWPGVPAELRIPVTIYATIVACDAAQATGRATVLGDRRALAVAIGAVFFMLSDMTIALYRFGHVGWPVDQATLPTYYLAQGLIAFFILPRSPSHD